MKEKLADSIEKCRTGGDISMGPVGAFDMQMGGKRMRVICGDDGGWDHVSVSFQNRCPDWSEMEYVRRAWFNDDEWVAQFSPPSDQRINNHPYCLHLWRCQSQEFPLPDPSMVGIKGLEPAR